MLYYKHVLKACNNRHLNWQQAGIHQAGVQWHQQALKEGSAPAYSTCNACSSDFCTFFVTFLLCRYTGFIQGLQETYKKTPVMAQVETKTPGEESFIHTRTCSPPKTTYHSMQRDPCNFNENFKTPEVENLWPRLQERAAQVCCVQGVGCYPAQ
eukprot:GHRQ01025707.1.p1 GENE.GHRQ01025707.1~~GHRQ01025707.1.p1  ORF type:complete len:154 (+),score=40.16 GHRQ01025707.1:150-611(+)